MDTNEVENTIPISNEALNQAVAEFETSFRERSFSGRHPDLGKMFNCLICGRRHRKANVCEQRFAKVRIGGTEELRQTFPVNPKPRLGIGPKNRMKPHFSRRRLQLVQRVQEFVATHTGAENFLNEIRDVMLQYLKRDWKLKAKIYRDTQKESRAINAVS